MDPIDLLGVGSHAVGQDDRVVIQIIGVRHGGADAAVRLRADDDDIFHVFFPQYKVSYGAALLYGFAGSLCGMFGDLCFSIIKRQTGIKDYGNLIPGHGGVLDRLDSMVMVAPLVEALMLLIPLVV